MENKKNKIFIIDDDAFILDVYAVKFNKLGFDVHVATSGVEALEKLKGGFVPDIMLLDVVMPKMDGFELMKIIRQENLIPDCLIIILTNLGQKGDIQKGLDLKADDYVIKAYFTPSEIAKKVETLLQQKK